MAARLRAMAWTLLGRISKRADDLLKDSADLLDDLDNVVRVNEIRHGINDVNAFLAFMLPAVLPAQPQDPPEEEQAADADPPEEEQAAADADPPEEEQAADADPFSAHLFLESMDELYGHMSHAHQILETVKYPIPETVHILEHALGNLQHI